MFTPWLPPNPTLIQRWGWLLYWLFEGMGRDWWRRGLRHERHGEIGQRIMGLWKRLYSVLRRWEAGTLCPPRVRVALTPHPPASGPIFAGKNGIPSRAPPSPSRGEGQVRSAQAWSVLPRRFGWLRSLLSAEGQWPVVAFHFMLEEPEMKAIMAAAPQVGRILRPLCHFLGIETPVELRLPKRKRVRKTQSPPELSEADEEKLRRLTARFPDTPPARAAKRALRRMYAGLPVDVTKLSAVAYGYFVHPPRDGNCPPPEIGYGGRTFAPLPKDYEWPKD